MTETAANPYTQFSKRAALCLRLGQKLGLAVSATKGATYLDSSAGGSSTPAMWMPTDNLHAMVRLAASLPRPLTVTYGSGWVEASYDDRRFRENFEDYRAEAGSVLPLTQCVAMARAIVGESTQSELDAADPAKFVIKAEVHSDDLVIEIAFDAVSWFKQADEDDLARLAGEGWQYDAASDAVAEFCSADQPDIRRVFDHIHNMNKGRAQTGFGCSVDEDDAMAWLDANRPGAAQRIREEVLSCKS